MFDDLKWKIIQKEMWKCGSVTHLLLLCVVVFGFIIKSFPPHSAALRSRSSLTHTHKQTQDKLHSSVG